MKFDRAFFIIALAVLPASAQNFRQIRDGLEHAQFDRQVKTPEKETARVAAVHALRIDLKKARLDVVRALDATIGVETTSSIARRHNALAAINAGFFRLDRSIFNGEPAGVLKIDGKLLSESYAERIALLITNKPDQIGISFTHLSASYCFAIKGYCFESGVNRERKDNDSVIYTPDFHRTTLTSSSGAEILVKNGKIVQIIPGKGSSVIPADGFVFSISGKKREEILPLIKPGMKASLSGINRSPGSDALSKSPIDGSYLLSANAEDIVGGVPQLIKNGKIEITWEREKSSESFVETRHPRTAIAKLKDGRALLVTVDGRSPTSAGMNLQELAEMLLEMGATDAMNLDGGGSTTMFLNGKVVNKPSDKEGERPVSDAILVTLRK